MTHKTNLDRLNELLKHESIPDFRKVVSPSLNNLKWLKTRLTTSNAELRKLLALDVKQLHEPCAE